MGSDEKWAARSAAEEEIKRTPVHEAPGVKEALAFVAREYALDAGQINDRLDALSEFRGRTRSVIVTS